MTTSNLPAQHRKAIEDARALLTPETEIEGNTANAAPVTDSAVVDGTQPADAAPQVTSPDPVPFQPAEDVQATKEDQPTLDAQPDHRYDVLLGKYNAEVPRMAKQIRELQAEIDRLTKLPAPAAEPTKSATATKAIEVTDEMVRQVYTEDEIDEFGIDHWKMHLKGSLFMQQANAAQQQTPDSQDRQSNTEEQFYLDLTALVPDAADRNVDPDFLSWLQGYDPVSRQQYMTLLLDAESRRDSVAAAAIFDLHKSKLSRGHEPSPATPTIASPNPAKAGPSVASQVAPSGQPTAIAPARPTMTLSEYTKQSNAIARMTPSQPVRAGELRKVLRAAMNEGRVVDDNDGTPVMRRATA